MPLQSRRRYGRHPATAACGRAAYRTTEGTPQTQRGWKEHTSNNGSGELKVLALLPSCLARSRWHLTSVAECNSRVCEHPWHRQPTAYLTPLSFQRHHFLIWINARRARCSERPLTQPYFQPYFLRALAASCLRSSPPSVCPPPLHRAAGRCRCTRVLERSFRAECRRACLQVMLLA